MKRVLLLLPLLSLTACVTLTPRAQRIQVQNQNSAVLATCKKLGPVTAKASSWGKMTYADANQQAVNNLRDAAAAQYGDQVDSLVLVNVDTMMTSSYANGIAYNCFGNGSTQ